MTAPAGEWSASACPGDQFGPEWRSDSGSGLLRARACKGEVRSHGSAIEAIGSSGGDCGVHGEVTSLRIRRFSARRFFFEKARFVQRIVCMLRHHVLREFIKSPPLIRQSVPQNPLQNP